MRICDLKNKEVVNVCDGKIIGYVSDVDFDLHKGCICAIIVPGPIKFCSFCFRDIEYVIPFERIECIGPDVILVKVKLEDVTVKCS
ncbi:MAG: YlmC/YmxH family sporulation protein [Thermoflexaceae bacterium]|nr:YlmC/YmxH family sporulation protein [Thermoflexaceae bacterium]